MTSWTITLGYSVEAGLTDDQIDTILEQLADVGVALSVATAPPSTSLTVTVDALTIHEAIAEAAARTNAVVSGTISSIEAITTEAFDRALHEPTIPDLVGIAEIAEILGVSRQRAHVLTGSPAFPEPVARLAATPVWRRTAAEAYAAIPRKTGRPAGATKKATPAPTSGTYSKPRPKGGKSKALTTTDAAGRTHSRIVDRSGKPVPAKKVTSR